MTADHVNGLFEAVGSVAIWLHVRRLMIDKQVRGASWSATAFFMAWGYWNLYYYPHLDQWWSFAGGCSIVVANTAWLVLMLYYLAREKDERDPFSGSGATVAEAWYGTEKLRSLSSSGDEAPLREPDVAVPGLREDQCLN